MQAKNHQFPPVSLLEDAARLAWLLSSDFPGGLSSTDRIYLCELSLITGNGLVC